MSRTLKILAPMMIIFLFGVAVKSTAAPTVTFYTDRAKFESGLASSVVDDFEGMVEDTEVRHIINHTGNGMRLDGLIAIAGSNSNATGAPFNSAVLLDDDGAISMEIIGAATAVGGWFGDTSGSGVTTLSLYGTAGLLDTRQVSAGDMGLGSSETFYGWKVFGDVITDVVHDTGSGTAGVDDLVTGSADWFGPAGSIQMHPIIGGMTDFTSCQGTTTFVPGSFGLFEFEIRAYLGGTTLQGVTTAEFRVIGGESFPDWTIGTFPLMGHAVIGEPMFPTLVGGGLVHRASVAFPLCEQLDSVSMLRVIFTSDNGASDIPADTRLQVVAGDPPGDASFNCPLLTLCDSPAFTKVCVAGGEFVINPASMSCSVLPDPPTDVGPPSVRQSATWSQIKRLYR